MENIDENESEENQRMAFDTVVTGRNCVVTSDCHIYGCSSCVVANRSSKILYTKLHNLQRQILMYTRTVGPFLCKSS